MKAVAYPEPAWRRHRVAGAAALVVAAVIGNACGGGGDAQAGSSGSTGGTSTAASLAAGYRQAKWQAGVTVSFSGDCTMSYTSSGNPSHGLAAYYLVPVQAGGTVVAVTPYGGLQLGIGTLPLSTRSTTYTFNICPATAARTTTIAGGAMGWMLSGAALFNAFEGDQSTVATRDNVSVTFTDSQGATQRAAFLDNCAGHQAPQANQYHYHGWSACLRDAAGDGTTGASHLIGIALDGFPIYGDRDLNGNRVATTALDECNGITSPTPEFPGGVYHYVLPEGSLSAQSAPRCYRGTVPAQLAVQMALNASLCVTPGTAQVAGSAGGAALESAPQRKAALAGNARSRS